MKFKKGIQRVLEFIAAFTILLVMMSLESDFTTQYLMFLFINLTLFVTSTLLLIKFGKYE